jgi:hypothetical protein
LGGAGAAALAGVLAGPGRGLLQLLPFVGDDDKPVVRSTLSPFIGSDFTVHRAGQPTLRLTLAKVADLPSPTVVSNIEGQFRAVFNGPLDNVLSQDTYQLRHSEFGKVDMFLVPMFASDAPSASYEAVFNRLPEEVAT